MLCRTSPYDIQSWKYLPLKSKMSYQKSVFLEENQVFKLIPKGKYYILKCFTLICQLSLQKASFIQIFRLHIHLIVIPVLVNTRWLVLSIISRETTTHFTVKGICSLTNFDSSTADSNTCWGDFLRTYIVYSIGNTVASLCHIDVISSSSHSLEA